MKIPSWQNGLAVTRHTSEPKCRGGGMKRLVGKKQLLVVRVGVHSGVAATAAARKPSQKTAVMVGLSGLRGLLRRLPANIAPASCL